MIRFALSVDESMVAVVADLNARSQAVFQRALQRETQGQIQRQADELLGEDPGPVRYPFAFATERSRRAYFASDGFGKGIPYRRTGKLQKSWAVSVAARLGKGAVVVRNTAPYAKWVYGPRQVPGHQRTGWGRDLGEALEYLRDYAEGKIIDAWAEAVAVAAEE